jgi:CRP-like cAMP-binding protein
MAQQTTGNHAANALMIPEGVLESHGARCVRLAKGEVLFEQGQSAVHFHIVRSGRIKMSNYNDEGREFVQGYFVDGEPFGEPPFFAEMPYPASAIAVLDSEVWRCARDPFLELLRLHPDAHLRLTEVLSRRLIYKSMMLSEIAVQEAEHRLSTLIDYLRRSAGAAPGEIYRVRLTRQQLADMTGLRVETVIRTIKGMESRGMLRIEDGRIAWRGPDPRISDEE